MLRREQGKTSLNPAEFVTLPLLKDVVLPDTSPRGEKSRELPPVPGSSAGSQTGSIAISSMLEEETGFKFMSVLTGVQGAPTTLCLRAAGCDTRGHLSLLRATATGVAPDTSLQRGAMLSVTCNTPPETLWMCSRHREDAGITQFPNFQGHPRLEQKHVFSLKRSLSLIFLEKL